MRLSALCLSVSAFSLGPVFASDAVEAPWNRNAFDVESGGLWQFGHNTNLNYQLIPTQFSWRSPYIFKKDLSNGSTLVLRNQASLIATWITVGPEDHYFGVSGAPSIEWWSADNKWSAYFSIGGGVGVTNSAASVGGLGQDFTLNWFAKAGVRRQFTPDFAVFGGPMFQHMSNGGATDPNPGIDAIGFSLGTSFSF